MFTRFSKAPGAPAIASVSKTSSKLPSEKKPPSKLRPDRLSSDKIK